MWETHSPLSLGGRRGALHTVGPGKYLSTVREGALYLERGGHTGLCLRTLWLWSAPVHGPRCSGCPLDRSVT